MFKQLETWFNTFFVGYASLISAALATALVPVALAGLTVYIGIYGFAVMRGEAPEPVATFFWKMVKVAAIFAFALPGLRYSGDIITGAIGLQDSMAALFVAPGTGSGMTAFEALDAVDAAADVQIKAAWAVAGFTRLDLVVAAVVLGVGTAIFETVGAFVGLLSRTILTFALAIGPIAILCLLFKSTARFFDSWLSVLLSAIVLSWFVFFALGMSMFVGTKLIAAMALGAPFLPAGGDSVNAVNAAFTYLSVMVLLAILLYQSPSLASSLTGGSAIQSGAQMVTNSMVAMRAMSGGGRRGGAPAGNGAGGSVTRGGGGVYATGRAVGATVAATGRGAGAVATGARAAYQRVAQRGNSST